MPAVRMTKVMPTASRPVIDTCRITLNRLISDRKPRLNDREQNHQDDKEQQRREARDEAEDVDSLVLGRFQPRLAHVNSPFKPLTRAAAALMRRHHRHQDFLRRLGARDLAGDAALAHRHDAIRDRQNFRQLRRNDDDRDAVTSPCR